MQERLNEPLDQPGKPVAMVASHVSIQNILQRNRATLATSPFMLPAASEATHMRCQCDLTGICGGHCPISGWEASSIGIRDDTVIMKTSNKFMPKKGTVVTVQLALSKLSPDWVEVHGFPQTCEARLGR